jgi:hypothetical protein
MAKPTWRKRLYRFDKSGVFWKLLLEDQDEIIQGLVKGVKPIGTEKLLFERVEKYGVFETEYRGWSVTIRPEVGTATPEYRARHAVGLKKKKEIEEMAEKTRKKWKKEGKPLVQKSYLAITNVRIAKIDKLRTLAVESQHTFSARYGEFLCVEMKNRPDWPLTKFDINIGGLVGKDLYDFVEELIGLSKKCKVGVDVKPLWMNRYKRFLLKEMHLYPRLGKGLSDKEKIEKLIEVYDAAKEIWGDGFAPNPYNNLKGFLLALKESGRIKSTKVKSIYV